jgi:ribose-phosphate pyrophosphokinase
MSEMKIIAGASSQVLAKRVSDLTQWDIVDVEYRRFPDGESYLRVCEEVERVAIIQSTRTNDDIIVLLQLLDACESAEKHVVIPYFGYARQDKRFKNGEPISSRAIASIFKADSIAVVNIHSEEVMKYFRSPAKELDASEVIGKYISSLNLRDPLIISPDYGAIEMVEKISKVVNCEYAVMMKERISDEEVRISAEGLEVKGRDVIIVDDIISTGGTIKEALKILKKMGVGRVFVGCVHPVLVGDALLKLYRTGAYEVFGTDTIESSISKVSVAEIIASYLESL